MRFLVLGAGLQGTACAYDLLRNPQTDRVTLVDNDSGLVQSVPARLVSDKLRTVENDCADESALAAMAAEHQVVISALPYRLNLAAAKACIGAGTHFVDMGGHIKTVLAELRLSKIARDAGVCLVPDCGLAPGLTNVLVADAIAELGEVRRVRIRVGGLPAHPRPPWNYQMVFSPEGLISQYTGSAAILRDWNRTDVDALTGVETIEFPEPLGTCEAAYTSGGSSTLPWSYAGRIRSLDYKTVRYLGHYHKLQALAALGLFDEQALMVAGVSVSPRNVAHALFQSHLRFANDPDLVVLRVESLGKKDKREVVLVHEMMDHKDTATGLTAMMRTTAFSVSIVAQMIADGSIEKKGAFPPEMVVPPAKMIHELGRRNILVKKTWKE